ncbi:MAG: hypothetical protein NUW01_06020 [Gemmatimonadaceae bacterium]|nr:hypothetical protein [Gemmatimonadaceae bacterium]
MFFTLPDAAESVQSRVQELLDTHHPIPDGLLNKLAHIGANTPDTRQGAELRRLILDVDDLLVQLRWHVAQAMLIWKAYPQLWTAESEADQLVSRLGMPTKVRLLLRHFVVSQSKVFYADVEERLPGGGTVAGWVMHMMVDNAVGRSIGLLDRLARLAAVATGVEFDNNKVYFRSRKLSAIREVIGADLGDPLVALADSEEVSFLLDYRDNLSHMLRPTSWIAGAPPADGFMDEAGTMRRSDGTRWGADEMAAIAIASYVVVERALKMVVDICASHAPQVKTGRSDDA